MSRTSSANDRIAWVDYSKGFCIILVVMMHSTLGVQDAAGAQGFMHYVVDFARPFRMPDFFLISGLFVGRVIDRDWRNFLDKKLVHFGYFYLLWFLIQGAFKWPALGMAEGPGAVAHAFAVGLIDPFGTLWFIYLLPIFFITVKLLRKLPPVVLLGAAALLQSLPINTGWVVIDEFALRFVFFATGWYAAPYVFAFSRWVAANRLASVGLLLVWGVVNNTAVVTGYAVMPGISLLLGYAGACAVISVASILSTLDLAAPIRYAGRNSIVIYLAFFLPMAATRIVLLKTGVITDIGWVSLIVTAVAVISPLILHYITEKTGHGRFLFVRPAAFHLSPPRQPALQPAE